jgi:hypothetical protein
LDIRDLSSVTDSIAITGTVTATGTVTIQDGGNSITVDANSFDIRTLTASDTVTVSGLVQATGSVTINTTSGAVTTTLTDGVDDAIITASGALMIDSDQTIQVNIYARPGSWENINYDVPPTSNSGTGLDPTTGTPMAFYLVNEGTSYCRVSVNNTSDATHGLYVGSKGTLSGQFMAITYLSVYNPDSATATISVMYGRE